MLLPFLLSCQVGPSGLQKAAAQPAPLAARLLPGTLLDPQLLRFAGSVLRPEARPGCQAPVLDFPRWQGFPVTRCPYADIGATTHPFLLNADPDKLAHWVVTACLDAKASAMDACISWLAGEMQEASSYDVFPVAGYIPEPEFGGYCFLFRDGVTVKTALRPSLAKPANGSCGDDDAESRLPLTSAGRYARVASTTREDYALLHPEVPTDGVLWVDVTRKEYQKAWRSDRNELLSAKAISGVKAGALQ